MNTSTLLSLARFSVAGLLLATAASAATIKLQVGPNSNGGTGGAYTAQILPGSGLSNALYSNATKNVGNWDPSFETFCLEKGEYFTPNKVYNFTIDTYARADYNHDGDSNDANEIDPLSQGSAWLYQKYALGQFNSLVGSTFTNWKALNQAFQATIWCLEGDTVNFSYNHYFSNLVGNKFSNFANAKANATGNAYGVRVLNLWTKDANCKTIQAQSQLYYVPDTASTLALVGAALAGLVAFRRRTA
ncbi:VPDSG-CTERM sorting domain-containing protein [Nibricoccus sp. IMCC34717]|uniref:VPDSG-CTERM sorting domain-containing protein n=1 Tax=Nibricoccus sp. IMCC34717 TaxID=3034021 RepID=UPI00384A55A9